MHLRASYSTYVFYYSQVTLIWSALALLCYNNNTDQWTKREQDRLSWSAIGALLQCEVCVSPEVLCVAHRSTAGQSGIPAVGAGAALFPHLLFLTTHTCARLFTGCTTLTVIREPAGHTGASRTN